jgi:hypothetical protein
MNSRSLGLAAIRRNLNEDERKPPLVIEIELVWTRKLDATRGFGALVISTARRLTTYGGNGWTGLDARDLDELNDAIKAAVDEVGATGIIDRFIVKQHSVVSSISDEDIDRLFDV